MPQSMPLSSDGEDQARPKRVGAYAKLLANYASDDAIIEAGEAAELLFVRGLAFCATSDADGFITDAQVTRYVGAGMRDAAKRAQKLAEVGVWERLDGGYLVRSWLKIHDSAAEKGRKRKADRERKAKKTEPLDSEPGSERIPAGIPTVGAAESLSLNKATTGTRQRNDTTAQVDGSSRGDRPVTLRPAPATEHPPISPADARCTAHFGVADPGPCNGCRAARERAERKADANAERAAREAEAARLACTRCDGVFVVDEDTKQPTKHRCDHTRRAS